MLQMNTLFLASLVTFASAEFSYSKSNNMCAGTDVGQNESSEVRFGPCSGSSPEAYFSSEFHEAKIISSSDSTKNPISLTLSPGLTKISKKDVPTANNAAATFSYTSVAGKFGDLNTYGLSGGTASYLGTSDNPIISDTNDFVVYKKDGTIGTYKACIADVVDGKCSGQETFQPGEYAFSLFGFNSGSQLEAKYAVWENEGLDALCIRMKFTANMFALSDLQVNDRPYDDAKSDEEITKMSIDSSTYGKMSFTFDNKCNYGTALNQKEIPDQLTVMKQKNVKIHIKKESDDAFFLEYVFPLSDLGVDEYFAFGPHRANTDYVATTKAPADAPTNDIFHGYSPNDYVKVQSLMTYSHPQIPMN